MSYENITVKEIIDKCRQTGKLDSNYKYHCHNNKEDSEYDFKILQRRTGCTLDELWAMMDLALEDKRVKERVLELAKR